MKTTNHYYLKNLLLLCTLMLSYCGFAQVEGASFTYTLANATNPTPTTLEFDVNLVVNHTGTAASDGGIKISQIQFGVNFNKDILNGGTPSTTANLSFTILPATQDPIFTGTVFAGVSGQGNYRGATFQATSTDPTTYGMLRVVGTLSNATAPLVPNGTYRIGRYRFSNTTTWAVSSNAQLWINTGNFSGATNAIVAGLKNGTSTPAFAYTPTAPAIAPGVTLGYTQAAPLSLLLNPAPCSLTTTWDGNAWAPFQPIATQAAVIDGNYSSTGDLSACLLTVSSGTVVVNAGHDFNITGAVTVNGGSLTFENNANLVQVNDVDNTGLITVRRNATMRRLDYVYWGSPVAGQDLKLFSPYTVSLTNAPGFPTPTGTSRFYTLNEPTNAFVVIAEPLGVSFAEAKGYMLRAPNNFPSNGNQATFNGVFAGVPNNGNSSLPITNTGAGKGFNMLGNPYPSTVSADLFLAQNPGELYFWTHTNQDAPSGANYATYTTFGTASAAGGAVPNGTIAVGQGFLLKTPSPSATATFTNSMRTGNNSATFFRNANVDKHRIWLNLSNSTGLQNQILVGYMNGATNGIDVSVDAKQIESGINNIATLIGDEKFNIQARALPFADTDEIPMSFNALAAGSFSISLDHTDGLFADNQDIFIKDNLTGTIHSVKEGAYGFAAEAGTTTNRFSIVFQNTDLHVGNPAFTANGVIVFNNANVLNINSGSIAMQSVKVFDMRGRFIYEKDDINATTTALKELRAEQEVLLVQITSENGEVVTKKVVY